MSKALNGEYVLIHERTLADAWENAVRSVWLRGRKIPKYGKEAVALVVVDEPFGEPRRHRGDMMIALMGTVEKYVDEVLKGTLDWAIEKGMEPYTYHQRLFSYPLSGGQEVDQIAVVVDNIKRDLASGDITNRNQATTWRPGNDPGQESPPCLQRTWFKPVDGCLEMHTEWRSRDCFKAMDMNMLAMTELQKHVAEKVGLHVGRYVDYSDSLHIYDRDWEMVERFLAVLDKRRSASP